MNRTSLINQLIEKHNLTSYLEIGLQNPANNFNKINCNAKSSVDPDPNARAMYTMKSDDFFRANKSKYSLVFIDGWHEVSQVTRDLENSLKCLTENGFVVLHDCLPDVEQYTTIPRVTKQWYGNVYQLILNLHTYDGIDFITYPFDCGCTVVWKDPTKKGSGKIVAKDWNSYLKNKHLLNIRDVVE